MILEIVIILLIIGLVFNLLGSIGILRFPDVYTRLHAGSKCATFGSIFTSLAVVVYGSAMWYTQDSMVYADMVIHTVIAVICLLITNPTGAHAIARAAHRSGIMPIRAVVDRLKEEK
ncbi:MAG: monovalent cation/H(+) antiporter subunit G [Methanophagales archaeon]|nr:monovalent cation/H(+) antiporter subunit G [Methanophagales archaeon]